MIDYSFSIGELIKAIRISHFLTQAEFAKSINVAQSTISKVEKNLVEDITFSLVSAVSKIYNMPVIFFQAGLHSKGLLKITYLKYGLPFGGDLSAKTLFFILENFSLTTNEDPYTKVGIKRELLAYSLSQFDISILDPLVKDFKDSLEKTVLSALGCSGNIFQGCGEKIVSIINLSNVFKIVRANGSTVQVVLCSDTWQYEENSHLYATILALELSVKLKGKFNIIKESLRNSYLIEAKV